MQQRIRLKNRGICVVIPTYDNAGTIVDVVTGALCQCDDVIVVCDGCTDNTVALLKGMATANKPVILELEHNCGKGAALKAGFRYALEAGFSYAITLDGDGQHFPEDISVMLRANTENPGALIVGARKNLDSAERSAGSRFANGFSNFWFAVQTGHCLPDTQTGYRLYPLKRLSGLSFLTSRYEAELELLVFASWNGVKVVSVPVNVYYPSPDERVSHFRPARDFLRISVLNTLLCVLALVYGFPRAVLRILADVLRTLYILFVFFFFTVCVVTPYTIISLGIGKKTERRKYRLHRIINRLVKFALYRIPGIRYTTANPYDETFEKPSVVICNHQSHLDLLPMLALTDKMIILTTDWVWNDPFYGYIIRNADFLPASYGMERILPRLKELVNDGYSIAVYPEGTRSADCRVGRFHQGAFHIARELGIDVLPVVLYGSGHALAKHRRIIHRWPMHLEIDRRITEGGLQSIGSGLKEQASFMRNYYRCRYSQIADKMEQDV